MNEVKTMEGKSARTSSKRKTPEQRKRMRIIQIVAGIVFLAAYIGLSVYVQGVNPKGAFILLIGLGFGYVLQRSRFCFTASLRDPILVGSTALTKGVLLAFMVSSVLYAAIQIQQTGLGMESFSAISDLPGNIRGIGLNTVVGGFVFGIGAVIAGGCASGTFMRMGEGFAQQWITVIFFIVGSMLGVGIVYALTDSFIFKPGPAYLPEELGGWIPALLVQFVALLGLYVLADWYGKKKSGEI